MVWSMSTSRKNAWRFPGNDLVLGTEDDGSKVVLPYQARSGNLWIPGLPGSGKSRLLSSLIRQEIANWQRTKCGLFLLDPHGELFDSILAWLARNPQYKQLPLVLMDLSKDDW